MNLGFISNQSDPRCPLSHVTLNKFLKDGFTVRVENGIGASIGISFPDLYYSREEVIQKSEIICCVDVPNTEVYDQANDGSIFISFYQSYAPGFDMSQFGSANVSVFSLDMIPRSTLAQSMDALSAMASLAGYKAVLQASERLPRMLPMMMTASGAIRPANVLILGAGVAGLQAIATAKRLGARVEAFDVRSAVKEEVQSLGAKFVEVEGAAEDRAAGGYAIEQTEDYKRKQKEAIAASVKKSDIIITTAQLRGRPAPELITTEMVESMSPGSVIVDMASSTGGNCKLSKDGETVIYNEVSIIGNSELYLLALDNASDLLANIYYNFIQLLHKENEVQIDKEHPILTSSMIFPEN